MSSNKLTDLKAFMMVFGFDNKTLATFVGVSPMAVHYWLTQQREIPDTVIKTVRFFTNKPELMNEYL